MRTSQNKLKVIKNSKKKSEKKKEESFNVSNFENAVTLQDRLKEIRKLLLRAIPVAESSYYIRPTQSNAYALSNLINQLQSIEEQISETVEVEYLTKEILNKAILPNIEELILELGKRIKHLTLTSPEKVSKKQIKKVLNKLYINFGKSVQESVKKIEENTYDTLAKNL